MSSYTYEQGGFTYRRYDDGRLERVKPKNLKTVEVFVPRNRTSSQTNKNIFKGLPTSEKPLANSQNVISEQITNAINEEPSKLMAFMFEYAKNGGSFWNMIRNLKVSGQEQKAEQLQDIATAKELQEEAKAKTDLLNTTFWENIFQQKDIPNETAFQEQFLNNVFLQSQIDQLLRNQEMLSQAKEQGISEGQIKDIITTQTSKEGVSWTPYAIAGAVILALGLGYVLTKK